MQASNKLPGYRWFGFLENVQVRVGIYTGVCLSVCFAGWVVAANRIPFLERISFGRNVSAVTLLAVIAAIPVVRFRRHPGDMLGSSLLAWTLLTVTYFLLCLAFPRLNETYTAFQIFMIGTVVYLLIATLAWLGTIIRRVRASDVSHINH